MARYLMLAGMLACLMPLAGAAAQPVDSTLEIATRLATQAPQFDASFNAAPISPEAPPRSTKARPSQALLDLIASWLGASFDLPIHGEPPHLEWVPPAKLAALRYRGLTVDRGVYLESANVESPSRVEQSGITPEIYAFYDDKNRAIYLPEDWQGVTINEISILVHEMVHHLQNLAGLKYPCPQERERLAYEAQDKWLALFGTSLEQEFGFDAFTILARALCRH